MPVGHVSAARGRGTSQRGAGGARTVLSPAMGQGSRRRQTEARRVEAWARKGDSGGLKLGGLVPEPKRGETRAGGPEPERGQTRGWSP